LRKTKLLILFTSLAMALSLIAADQHSDAAAAGSVYYVALNGNDTNPDTPAIDRGSGWALLPPISTATRGHRMGMGTALPGMTSARTSSPHPPGFISPS